MFSAVRGDGKAIDSNGGSGTGGRGKEDQLLILVGEVDSGNRGKGGRGSSC